MGILIQIAALGTILFGIVYVIIPRRAHEFGFESLRNASSLSSGKIWLYRILGVGLIITGYSHLF
jgi:hypothetical protein